MEQLPWSVILLPVTLLLRCCGFADDVTVEEVTANNDLLFLEGGRYLYIRALTAAQRMMRYHCAVRNFHDENGMPMRAPTTYILTVDPVNVGFNVYKGLSEMVGEVGTPVQYVYAAVARDEAGDIAPFGVSCPPNHPLLIFLVTEHIINVTLREAARSENLVNFTCQAFGHSINDNIMGTIIVTSEFQIVYTMCDITMGMISALGV